MSIYSVKTHILDEMWKNLHCPKCNIHRTDARNEWSTVSLQGETLEHFLLILRGLPPNVRGQFTFDNTLTTPCPEHELTLTSNEKFNSTKSTIKGIPAFDWRNHMESS